MNQFLRWCRFNLVGGMGMAVQLGVLAAVNHAWPGHYLAASAVALEVTLLHNFAWHRRFTWRDREDGSAVVGRLVRFHLSNGLVSLVGNLVVMQVLVHGAGMPVVAANAVAIGCCSVFNFFLGELWTFRAGVESAAL